MKPRSQRDSSIEAESTDAGGHSLRDNKLRNIQWDCADVDHMELDVSTGMETMNDSYHEQGVDFVIQMLEG
ncbi:uncharacterized protein FTOL_10722 [Fusarium torulosum]|uniref:Uncharacterized protein n=1 Tax=Fusarium torulosum TaxID=33205 RepID=A0AAE8SMA5_9HYPO|nr:uncharacterized protein FTOL_10722 [Fusarium torulosum]